MSKKKLKGIDLFCGIGGFRLAMEDAGVECVFSSDNDKFAQETYYANFGEVPQGDIKKIEAKDIPPFDILAAGFPCQPFSYADEKQGFNDEIRGTLFFDICRILEYHKPPMVFLENVKGLKSHENGKTLNVILDKLKELDYPHWNILSSLDYGLPQKRERWYCVAFRKDIDFHWPMPIGGHPTLKDIVDLTDDNPSLKLPQFELDRIDYHFATAKPGDRVKHDNSKYKPNTKKGKYGVYSYQKPDGSLRFHVGDYTNVGLEDVTKMTESICADIFHAASEKRLSNEDAIVYMSMRTCRRLLLNAQVCENLIKAGIFKSESQANAYLWMTLQPFLSMDALAISMLTEEQQQMTKIAASYPGISQRLAAKDYADPEHLSQIPTQLMRLYIAIL